MNAFDEIRAASISYEVTHYGEIHLILSDLSFCWKRGTTYALWGASGSGKSTLLHLLAGFQLPTKGSLWYGACNHLKLSEQDRTQLRLHIIGYVVQSAPLIPVCSVIENVIINGLISGVSYQGCLERGYELLHEVGLYHKATADSRTLSGGEQQRLALARALWNKPQWLFLDEPTAHLDLHTKQEIIQLLLSVHEKYAISMIVATHDEAIAQVLQKVIILSNGRIKE